jgi:hypothetical protein
MLLNDSDEEELLKKDKDKSIEKIIEKNDNNNYNELKDLILNINKKVEKMYILKKSKLKNNVPSVQPVIIETKKNNNPTSINLLNEMRNKMLN